MNRNKDKIKNAGVTVDEFAVIDSLDYVNEKLKGKTIKRLFDADQYRVMIEFEDGTMGMIEAMASEHDEKFLSIMPPNEYSEVIINSLENVKQYQTVATKERRS